MELAGIEPASEDSSIMASPITVYVLTFPHEDAHRQAAPLSSFINFPKPQSFGNGVSRNFDARFPNRGELGLTAALIRQRTRNFRLRLYLIPCFIVVLVH